MTRVIEVLPGEYLAYTDMGDGLYMSYTFVEEALKQPCHFDIYKELLAKREELCRRRKDARVKV